MCWMPSDESGSNLLKLLSDVANNPTVRAQYKADPHGVCDQYGLSAEEKQALQAEGTDGVLGHIGNSLSK